MQPKLLIVWGLSTSPSIAINPWYEKKKQSNFANLGETRIENINPSWRSWMEIPPSVQLIRNVPISFQVYFD